MIFAKRLPVASTINAFSQYISAWAQLRCGFGRFSISLFRRFWPSSSLPHFCSLQLSSWFIWAPSTSLHLPLVIPPSWFTLRTPSPSLGSAPIFIPRSSIGTLASTSQCPSTLHLAFPTIFKVATSPHVFVPGRLSRPFSLSLSFASHCFIISTHSHALASLAPGRHHMTI